MSAEVAQVCAEEVFIPIQGRANVVGAVVHNYGNRTIVVESGPGTSLVQVKTGSSRSPWLPPHQQVPLDGGPIVLAVRRHQTKKPKVFYWAVSVHGDGLTLTPVTAPS